MRFAVFVVAACAFAGALAVPVSRHTNVKGVPQSFGEDLGRKIRELVEAHSDVIKKIEATEAGNLLESLKKEAERINEELRKAIEHVPVPQNGPSSGPSEGEEKTTKEKIRQRISEIRKAIASATAELASIIWQQARAHGGKLSESLAIAKEKVVKRLSELKDELLVRIREAMIPDDDVPVNYVIDEVFEQIIANLKEQISDAVKVISDWHNLLTDSGREKIAAAKKRITELAKRIADTVREWRRAKQDSTLTTESSNYAPDPFYNDKLMLMLREFLEELKEQIELKKLDVSHSSVEAERAILAHLEEVDTQLTDSLESIREMIEKVTGVDVASSNIVANLRKLLALKMQQLEGLLRSSAEAEKIKTLEREIVNLRRRLIEAVQDVFQKP